MASTSRHPSSLAAAALLLALSIPACVSAPTPAPHANEGDTPPAVESPSQPVEEETEHLPNTLRWTTASEVDNFGFDVYRGDHEDGPFVRQTERPIAGAGTTDLTTKYSYEDMTNDPYKTYFYFVESISLQGEREQFTPIIEAKPKLTRDGEEGGDGADEAQHEGAPTEGR